MTCGAGLCVLELFYSVRGVRRWNGSQEVRGRTSLTSARRSTPSETWPPTSRPRINRLMTSASAVVLAWRRLIAGEEVVEVEEEGPEDP